MNIKNKRTGQIIGVNIKLADSFMDRLVGLMFKEHMNNMGGLLIHPCNSIHTCFMKFPIDVVFISKTNHVVKVIDALSPWRFTRVYFSAQKTLELPAHTLKGQLMVGDELEVIHA